MVRLISTALQVSIEALAVIYALQLVYTQMQNPERIRGVAAAQYERF